MQTLAEKEAMVGKTSEQVVYLLGNDMLTEQQWKEIWLPSMTVTQRRKAERAVRVCTNRWVWGKHADWRESGGFTLVRTQEVVVDAVTGEVVFSFDDPA